MSDDNAASRDQATNQDQNLGIGQNQSQVPITPYTGVDTPADGQPATDDPNSGANPLPDDLNDAEVDETGLNTDDIVPENDNTDDDEAEDAIGDLGDETNANA